MLGHGALQSWWLLGTGSSLNPGSLKRGMFSACGGDSMGVGGAGFRIALASQTGILCLCENSDSPQGRFILESLKEVVSEPSISGVPAPH